MGTKKLFNYSFDSFLFHYLSLAFILVIFKIINVSSFMQYGAFSRFKINALKDNRQNEQEPQRLSIMDPSFNQPNEVSVLLRSSQSQLFLKYEYVFVSHLINFLCIIGPSTYDVISKSGLFNRLAASVLTVCSHRLIVLQHNNFPTL